MTIFNWSTWFLPVLINHLNQRCNVYSTASNQKPNPLVWWSNSFCDQKGEYRGVHGTAWRSLVSHKSSLLSIILIWCRAPCLLGKQPIPAPSFWPFHLQVHQNLVWCRCRDPRLFQIQCRSRPSVASLRREEDQEVTHPDAGGAAQSTRPFTTHSHSSPSMTDSANHSFCSGTSGTKCCESRYK